MKNETFLCVDTKTGRVNRYERTLLFGMPYRSAGVVDIVNYNAYRPIAEETILALESFRKEGALG